MKTSLFYALGLFLALLAGCASIEPLPPEIPDTPRGAAPVDLAKFTEAEAFEAGFDPRVGSHLILLRTVGSRGAGVVAPIFVGDREAQALRMKLQGELSMRPMTHDLTVAFLEKLNAVIEYVAIEDMQEGVFLARIFFRSTEGTLLSLDSRASDAIILAVTAGRKIYIHRDVVKAVGIQPEGTEESISA